MEFHKRRPTKAPIGCCSLPGRKGHEKAFKFDAGDITSSAYEMCPPLASPFQYLAWDGISRLQP